MKKLAPLLVIGAGLITIIFAVISLLATHGVITNNAWVGQWVNKSKTPSTASYIIVMVISFIQITLGVWTWQKPRGFSSFLLMGSFGIGVAALIYASTTSSTWPISTIISLVINGLALIGLVLGFLKGNR